MLVYCPGEDELITKLTNRFPIPTCCTNLNNIIYHYSLYIIKGPSFENTLYMLTAILIHQKKLQKNIFLVIISESGNLGSVPLIQCKQNTVIQASDIGIGYAITRKQGYLFSRGKFQCA